MPLIWQILTPAERPPEFTISFAQLGAVFAAILGLAVMIGRMIFNLSAARRPSRSHSRDRGGLPASRRRPRKQVPPTFANIAAAATQQAGMAYRTGKTLSLPNDPVVDIEASVRRLFHQLQ